jgi:hypothetical protein
MPCYSILLRNIESEIPLGGIATENSPDHAFRLHSAQAYSFPSYDWFHSYQQDGSPWFLLGKQKSGYVLRFVNLADFLISLDGRQIDCYRYADTSINTVEHLLLDQVIPRIASLQGDVIIHASAVLVDNRIIAFLGETGWGKSTLAGSFSKLGCPILTDDTLLLKVRDGQVWTTPSYPGLRLWDDSRTTLFQDLQVRLVSQYNSKKRVTSNHVLTPDFRPVHHLYVLAPPNENDPSIEITRLPLQKSLMTLVEYAFRLDFKNQSLIKEEFYKIADISSLVPCFHLSYPRSYERLPQVMAAIIDHARS